MTKPKPQSKETQRRESLRRELQENVERMKATPAGGKLGSAGHRPKG